MTPGIAEQYRRAIESLRQHGHAPAVVEHLEKHLRLESGPFALAHLAGFGVALEGPHSRRHPDIEFRFTRDPHTWFVGRPGALQSVTCRHDGIVILICLLVGASFWPGTTEQATRINHRTLPQISEHWPDLADRLKVASRMGPGAEAGRIFFKRPPSLLVRVTGPARSADVGTA